MRAGMKLAREAPLLDHSALKRCRIRNLRSPSPQSGRPRRRRRPHIRALERLSDPKINPHHDALAEPRERLQLPARNDKPSPSSKQPHRGPWTLKVLSAAFDSDFATVLLMSAVRILLRFSYGVTPSHVAMNLCCPVEGHEPQTSAIRQDSCAGGPFGTASMSSSIHRRGTQPVTKYKISDQRSRVVPRACVCPPGNVLSS